MIEDASAQRRAIASVCYINQRTLRPVHPRFLRRNLRYILDSHQKQLETHSNAPARKEMIANEKRRWGWDYPTTDMLRDYMNGQKPVLQLEALQIRTPNSKARIAHNPRLPRERVDDSGSPDWLPDPEADAIWPCTVGIAVLVPRDNPSSRKQIQHEFLPASILRYRQSDLPDEGAYFDIKLQKPFYFEVDKLFVVTDCSTDGPRTWKRTITAPYLLEISIQCHDSHASARLLSLLEGRDVASYQDAPSSESVLKASWDRLPTCPPGGHLLSLRRSKGHKALELDYKLEAAMGWINRRDYVLKSFSKLDRLQQASTRQLPTPTASVDMEKGVKGYEILWNFNDGGVTRSMPIKALTCALCRNDHVFPTFPRLMLHCKREHDHFSFNADDVTEQPNSHSVHATILISAAPPQIEKLDAEEDKNLNWVAPDRPFNVNAYVRGKDDWTGETRPKGKKGVARMVKDRDAQPKVPATLPSRKRPAPEEVEDLPRHTPIRHRVPNVPGVTFYHTTSKQPIEPGSMVAESDEEVDESWLVQSQSRALDDVGLTGVAKDFTRAFNQHLAREQSNSSVLTRDALVRFTRAYRKELQDAKWQQLFRAKLKQLRGAEIILDDVVTYCIRLIREYVDPASASAGAESSDAHKVSGTHTPVSRQSVNGESSRAVANGVRPDNESRSVSPETGRLAFRERKRWTGGKSVSVRDTDPSSSRRNATAPPGPQLTESTARR